jgi:hypothetical protein
MSAALQIQSVTRPSRGGKRIRYKVTLSNNYAAGGQVIDFTAATNPKALPAAFPGRSPDSVTVDNLPDGHNVEVIPGVAMNDWKLKIWTTADTELAAAAYPANLAADANFFIDALFTF